MKNETIKTTLERMTKLLSDQLGIEESTITLESNLIADLGADSLDEIEMAMAIEEEFDVEIADEKMSSCKTVADLIGIV